MMMHNMVTLVTGLLTSFSPNLFHPAPSLDNEFHKYTEVTMKKKQHFLSVLALPGLLMRVPPVYSRAGERIILFQPHLMMEAGGYKGLAPFLQYRTTLRDHPCSRS